MELAVRSWLRPFRVRSLAPELLPQSELRDMHDGRQAMGVAVWLRRLGQLTDVGLHFVFSLRVTGAHCRVAGYGGGDGLLWRDQSQ